MTPIELARAQLRASPGGCWPLALQTLRVAYDPTTARDAWVALLSEPNSGWSTYDPQTGRWTLYCVPGYSPLCGDSIESCPIGPGQPDLSTGPQYIYAAPAGQAAPSSSGKWVLLFVVIVGALFIYMNRPESEEEKRYYRNRRVAA